MCLLRGTEWIFIYFRLKSVLKAVLWLRRRPGFDPRSVHVRYVVHKVVLLVELRTDINAELQIGKRGQKLG